MALCKGYSELDSQEEKELRSKLWHIIQRDQESFDLVKFIIRSGEQKGYLDSVKFGEAAMKEFSSETQ